MDIYIGNLSYTASEDDMRGLFQEYGTVDSVKIVRDMETGRSKGFGFVTMTSETEAQAAIEALNETSFKDRALKVNQARPKENRPKVAGNGFSRSRY